MATEAARPAPAGDWRQRLRTASLSARVVAGSAMLALLVAAAFGVLVYAILTLDDATKRERHAKDVTAATLRLEKLVIDLETGVRGFILTRNERLLDPFNKARADLPRQLREVERLVSANPAQQRRARELALAIRDYRRDYAEPVVELARSNPGIARDFVAEEEDQRRSEEIREKFSSLLAAEDALTSASAASANRESDRAIALAITGLIASAVFIVGFGLYLARSTARPVRAVATAASRLAEGDLSTRLEEGGPGEVGELTTSFNRMAEQLERGRAELEEQNVRLRESEHLKSELVSIVSHELRTPLASVLGFTSLLLTREVGSEEQRRYLEIIDAQGRRLSSLLNDFLDIQRLEEGQLQLARELFDLRALVREQVQLFTGQSDKHTLDVALPPQPLPVRGDPNRLAQVVGNLLSNAIKYSPEGGTVEIVGERDDGLVRVSVRDEGLGIPHELHDQVFGKFFRGDAAASGIAGSGLGLTIARSVVEAHGGHISFESASGRGSVFWLELPVAAGEG
jgi:signal transduction histidine kinase